MQARKRTPGPARRAIEDSVSWLLWLSNAGGCVNVDKTWTTHGRRGFLGLVLVRGAKRSPPAADSPFKSGPSRKVCLGAEISPIILIWPHMAPAPRFGFGRRARPVSALSNRNR